MPETRAGERALYLTLGGLAAAGLIVVALLGIDYLAGRITAIDESGWARLGEVAVIVAAALFLSASSPPSPSPA
jgi:hypothetical protein